MIFFIIIGLSLILYLTGTIDLFLNKQKLLDFLNSLGYFSFIGFIFLQVFQVIFFVIPGEVTGLLGGYLYGAVLGTILSTIGLTLGSYIAFALSRKFGRQLVAKLINKNILDRFDYLLHHKGKFLIFLLFLIPGFPKDSLCYILGLGHLSTTEFLIIGGIGRLLGTILLTFGGYYIKNQQYSEFFILAGIAVIVILISIAYKEKIEKILRILHIKSNKNKRKDIKGKNV